VLCFNGKHKKIGEQGSGEIASLDQKKSVARGGGGVGGG